MKNKRAFTLVEIMMVVAIIALLAAVGIPSFLNSRQGADNSMKEINISSVNSAKDQWAILNNKTPGTSVSWTDIEDYVGGADSLSDLDIGDDSLTLNAVGTDATY